jgi:hypothetical protein
MTSALFDPNNQKFLFCWSTTFDEEALFLAQQMDAQQTETNLAQPWEQRRSYLDYEKQS